MAHPQVADGVNSGHDVEVSCVNANFSPYGKYYHVKDISPGSQTENVQLTCCLRVILCGCVTWYLLLNGGLI
jgi:hypothetical protein